MAELVLVDPETNDEELLAVGPWDRMIERLNDMIEQADDDGLDHPWVRVQPICAV